MLWLQSLEIYFCQGKFLEFFFTEYHQPVRIWWMYWLDWPDCGSLSQTKMWICEATCCNTTNVGMSGSRTEREAPDSCDILQFVILTILNTKKLKHVTRRPPLRPLLTHQLMQSECDWCNIYICIIYIYISKKQKHFIRKKWWFTRGFFGLSVIFGQPHWFLLGNVVGVEVYGQVRQTGTLPSESVETADGGYSLTMGMLPTNMEHTCRMLSQQNGRKVTIWKPGFYPFLPFLPFGVWGSDYLVRTALQPLSATCQRQMSSCITDWWNLNIFNKICVEIPICKNFGLSPHTLHKYQMESAILMVFISGELLGPSMQPFLFIT